MSLGYSWLGRDLALDLANTVIVVRAGEEIDGLATAAGLARWLELERDRLGEVPGAEARMINRWPNRNVASPSDCF